MMRPDRMPPIPVDEYTHEQRLAAQALEADRGTPVFGPYVPLLRSPRVMEHAHHLGRTLRFESALPKAVSELVILIVSRRWTQQIEWYFHAPIAEEKGVSVAIIAAVAEGRRPQGMPEELELAYDICIELERFQQVTDGSYERAIAAFGERGFIDLVGIHGFYAFLATVMNAARTAVPESPQGPPPLKDLPE